MLSNHFSLLPFCCASVARTEAHPILVVSSAPHRHFARMRRLNSSGKTGDREAGGGGEAIAWELRPGGMLVQKRSDVAGGHAAAGLRIKIRVSHGSYQLEFSVPAQSNFGKLKKVLAQETGLEPREQRLLFRGKEKEDDECLHMAGVKDMSKVVLLEDPASKERKLERMKRDRGMLRACEAVATVRAEVDKLAVEVSSLEASVHAGAKAADKVFAILTELLMVQLLKLDSIEAEGEAKVQRSFEVRRVQNFLETVDLLKARNCNPFGNTRNASESRLGSLNAPRRKASSTFITNGWEILN